MSSRYSNENKEKGVEMIDLKPRTKKLLIFSPIFQHLTSQLDIIKLGNADPIDMSDWTLQDHVLVRAWSNSINFDQPPPTQIQQYLNTFK